MKKINPQLTKLMSMLNDGAFHDGDALGVSLAITRAAIWKMIAKLKEYGVPIESVKGKGYRLTTPLSLFDYDAIQRAFAGSAVHVVCYESIGSTNDYFKSQASAKFNTLDVCLAEHQTQGRGRFARPWVSPYGQNIYMSSRYVFDKDVSELGGLSLVVSMAIVAALQTLQMGNDVMVKWPNDVIWHHKKLAGVLVDVRAEAHGVSEVIIGTGINANLSQDARQMVSQSIASLSDITGQLCDRTLFVVQFIKQLVADLVLFNRAGWAAFSTRWERVDCLRNQPIVLLQGEKRIAGVAQGVNEQGLLLLQQEDGTLASFSSGEVSIEKRVLR